MFVVVGAVWMRPAFMWDVPPLWALVVALLVLAVGWRRVPLSVTAWWLLGLATLAYGLTPGATLVAALWTLAYLAAWAVAWRAGLIVALLWVLLQGVWSGLSLQLFGMAQYFSGSIGYLTGAVALALLPWAFQRGTTSSSLPGRVWGWLVSAIAAYAALSSGSRAVYLAFAVVALAMIIRTLLQGRMVGRTALTVAVVALAVGGANVAVPGRPITTALGLKARASVAALSAQGPEPGTGAAVADHSVSSPGPRRDENAIASRLKMWDQTLRIGLTHPFGTGLGSFRGTIAGFQRYPSVNFASAHNVLLEVFATEGWPGLLLMGFILVASLRRGWRDPGRWPFALGAAGLWLTMCFDITWSMPVIPLLGFWGLSVAHGGRSRAANDVTRNARMYRRTAPIVAGVAGWRRWR